MRNFLVVLFAELHHPLKLGTLGNGSGRLFIHKRFQDFLAVAITIIFELPVLYRQAVILLCLLKR